MEIRYVFLLIVVLIVFDITAVNLSFIYAHANVSNGHRTLLSGSYYVILTITWLAASYFTRLYHLYTIQSLKNLLVKSLLTFGLYALLSVIVFFIFNDQFHQKLVYYLGGQLFLVAYSRGIIYLFKNCHHKVAHYRRNVVIVGYNETGKDLHRYFLRNSMSFSFAGFFDNEVNDNTDRQLKGDLTAVIPYAAKHNIKEIYSTQYPEQSEEFAKLLTLAEYHCVKVRYVADIEESINNDYRVRYVFQGIKILSKRIEPLDLLRNRIIKRAFDIVLVAW